jgi:hypothetical protein
MDYVIYLLLSETSMMSSSLQFWKPGTLGPGSSLDRTVAEEDGFLPSAIPPQARSIQAQRDHLPIAKHSQQSLHFLRPQGCDWCSSLFQRRILCIVWRIVKLSS